MPSLSRGAEYAPRNRDRNWTLDAACRAADPEIFFPAKGRPDEAEKALAWCKICPVAAECLAEAMATPATDDWGVRGGTTERQRSRMRNRA
jgi:WhiB family transcriptional regulator, redox-sensing transcriptional regulator